MTVSVQSDSHRGLRHYLASRWETRWKGCGPERGVAWECAEGAEASVDIARYMDLFLRALETVVAPLGVARPTLDLWLSANAGYLAPPGLLPAKAEDLAAPLFAPPSAPRQSRAFLPSG